MKATIPDSIVRAVREEYARGGATQAQLAERFSIPTGTVRQWTAGFTRLAAGGPITRPGVNGHLASWRIEDHATVDDLGCWLWQGRLDKGGYGRLKRHGQFWFAHRYSWTIANGPIPDGMTIDHLCFVPACVNPSHLRLLDLSSNCRNQRRFLANVCKRGHEFTPENTRVNARGKRDCRTCVRARQNERNARLRAEGSAA